MSDDYIKRSPSAQRGLDALTLETFGRKQTEGECVMCGSTKMGPEDFRDGLSLKESRITYQCQSCQDITDAQFKAMEDE